MARRQSEGDGRRGYQERKTAHREPRQRFLIVCEGSKTEPNYFRAFRTNKDVVEVDVRGLGFDPLKLVQQALHLSKSAGAESKPYDQVWCVFDRDSWPLHDFKQALQLANEKKLHVAYSNEAFELWYLLHFDYHDTAISRTTYEERLTEKLGFRYRKNDKGVYDALLSRQKTAIQNVQKLLSQFNPPDPANDNPSTTVHLLVGELNKHARP